MARLWPDLLFIGCTVCVQKLIRLMLNLWLRVRLCGWRLARLLLLDRIVECIVSCQMLARPTDAVDHIVRCLAGWADAGQTDTDPLVIWLGVWQCGRPEACWASSRCAVG